MRISSRLPWALLVAALLSWGAVYMGLADGGAPVHEVQGVASAGPEVEAWHLGNESGVLCSHTETCPPAGESMCQWEGIIWLSSASNPAVLRDVSIEGWFVAWSGSGSNTTTTEGNASVLRDEGPWLRAISEHVAVHLELPCNAEGLRASFNIQAKTLGAKPWSQAQTLELALR